MYRSVLSRVFLWTIARCHSLGLPCGLPGLETLSDPTFCLQQPIWYANTSPRHSMGLP